MGRLRSASAFATGSVGLCFWLGGCALGPGRVAGLVHGPGARPIVVQTADGPVRGAAGPGGDAYLGLPYAAPPVGALRFQPPQPPVPWRAVRDATRAGAMCPQPTIPGAGRVSEDCLTLNVYAPADADPKRPRAVMVWLYGGGFAIGSNVQYDPSRLARRQDVVVVAPNYRLGALGFLAHPALSGAGEGAYALLDQQAALRWVRDNIANFGGDPRRVTLFGQSAGAWSACYQLTAPGAAGLFQRAILQSGACTSPHSAIPLDEAEGGGRTFAADLGCADAATAADCLRRLPVGRLRAAKPHRPGLLGVDSWAPAYGGDVLPLQPRAAFEQGRFAALPVIDGTDRDEGRLFLDVNRFKGELWTRRSYEKIIDDFFGPDAPKVLAQYEDEASRSMPLAYADIVTDATFACSALTLDRLLRVRAPLHAYEFDDPDAVYSLPQAPFTPRLKAYHSSELAYLFQTPWVVANPKRFDPAQRELSDRMQAYWGAFARTGDPNSPQTPAWPLAAADAILRLSPGPSTLAPRYAEAHRCRFWGQLGY